MGANPEYDCKGDHEYDFPEGEDTYCAACGSKQVDIERIAALEEGLRHMKRWASGYNVHTNPQIVLDAMVHMCDDTLEKEPRNAN